VVFVDIGHLPEVYVVSIAYFIQHVFLGLFYFVVFVGIGNLPEVSDDQFFKLLSILFLCGFAGIFFCLK